MKQFTGKIALVTGGNSGIGYAAARELKELGAEVIITGRRKEALDIASAELGVTGLLADQGSVPAIEELAAAVKEQFGKLDILFINAGVLGGSTIESNTEEIFDNVMNINFKGAYFTLSKFIPLLNDGASVVFLSSNTASLNVASSSIYSSSKAALNAIMRIAAVELAPRKIRVNAVSPGPTATDILNKIGLQDDQLESLNSWMIDRIPLKQFGRPEDVARMVAFLCKSEANFITGAEILMDGGMSL
ncbi:MAG: SDR family oxidoreductase [Bacteroidota bacterium]